MAHPLAALVRDHRTAAKRAGTYGRAWLDHVAADDRVYPGWRQLGAGASGCMSCAKPNLQQLPCDARFRRLFVAPEGRLLVKADYSQIELRLAAKIAGEPGMLAAYRRGEDLHTNTARAILGVQDVTKADRQLAKAVNFGLLYGMGAKAFAVYAHSNYGVKLTEPQAAAYRRKFFQVYPGLAARHRRAGDAPRDTRTVTGRRRLAVARFTERLNTPVQGTGADGLKATLALLWERRAACPGAVPVLAVHDEIVVEADADRADEAKAWLVSAMVDGMAPLADPVPVEVEATVARTLGGDTRPRPDVPADRHALGRSDRPDDARRRRWCRRPLPLSLTLGDDDDGDDPGRPAAARRPGGDRQRPVQLPVPPAGPAGRGRLAAGR